MSRIFERELAGAATVWVGGHDLAARRFVHDRTSHALRPRSGLVDLAVITPQSPDEAAYFAAKISSRLRPGGAIWVVISGSPGAGIAPDGELEKSWKQSLDERGWKVVRHFRLSGTWLAMKIHLGPPVSNG